MKFFDTIKIWVAAVVWKTGLKYLRGKGLQKIWPFGFFYNALSNMFQRHDWPESYIVDGHKMFVPPQFRYSYAIYKGSREQPTRDFFAREIPRGTTVIDIGANIGLHTLPFARCVGPEGEVYAFEPGPQNVALLEKNIAANGYKNVHVIPKALGDHSGAVTLYLSDLNPGDHRTYDPRRQLVESRVLTEEDRKLQLDSTDVRKAVSVEMVTLDDFLKDYKRQVSFVKIDVQGSEGAVVRGMRELIRKNPAIKLHFEFWAAGMRLFGTDPKEFLHELKAMGFRLYDTDDPAFIRHGELIELAPDELLRRCNKNESPDLFAKRMV
ncbi:MAG: FkbM family methyltransferase [bacterium]|nr:FkbM family methyltransferase [bacterium]